MLDFFISPAYAQNATPEPNLFVQIAIFGGLFVLMYFLLIRPQRKRQKEHQSIIDNLQAGDEIVLSSGMIGKLVSLDDHYISIKPASADENKSVDIKFQRGSVHAVLPKGTIKSLK